MTAHPFPDPFAAVEHLPVSERGAWLATSTGGMWSIEHPATRDVDIRDVAAGLSRNCRYNGQITEDCDFLSVAEHSTAMTKWAVAEGAVTTAEAALMVLLHDASEAYFGDMVTPLKNMIPDFRGIEDRAQAVIISAFGLDRAEPEIAKKEIKRIDNRIRLDERDRAIADPARTAGKNIIWLEDASLEALGVPIAGLNPREARIDFYETFVACCENLPFANPEIEEVVGKHVAVARDHLAQMQYVQPEAVQW